MNVVEFVLKSPITYWTMVLFVGAAGSMRYIGDPTLKAALASIFVVLFILSWFSVAPPFVTRREVILRRKFWAHADGVTIDEESFLGSLLHRIVTSFGGRRVRKSAISGLVAKAQSAR